jgi:hypothetical protein
MRDEFIRSASRAVKIEEGKLADRPSCFALAGSRSAPPRLRFAKAPRLTLEELKPRMTRIARILPPTFSTLIRVIRDIRGCSSHETGRIPSHALRRGIGSVDLKRAPFPPSNF